MDNSNAAATDPTPNDFRICINRGAISDNYTLDLDPFNDCLDPFQETERAQEKTQGDTNGNNDTPCAPRSRCKNPKNCLYCARKKQQQIGARIVERASDNSHNFYLLTLTLPSSANDLAAQADNLVAAFSSLRELKAWTTTVVGGARGLDVTRNRASGCWHVHLHAVVETLAPLDCGALALAWAKRTGATDPLDHLGQAFKPISRDEYSRKRTAQYICKPLHESLPLESDRRECMRAWKGRRMVAPFGRYWGEPLIGRKRKRRRSTE